MKPLAYLAALHDLVQDILYIDTVTENSDKGQYLLRIVAQWSSTALDVNIINENKPLMIKLSKRINLSNIVFDKTEDLHTSFYKWILEQEIQESDLLKNESIYKALSTDNTFKEKYYLNYEIFGKKILKPFNYTDKTYDRLKVYFMVRAGYKISEVMGENCYVVKTPDLELRYLNKGSCECREFNLINQTKFPCQHLLFADTYKKYRSDFVQNQVGALKHSAN